MCQLGVRIRLEGQLPGKAERACRPLYGPEGELEPRAEVTKRATRAPANRASATLSRPGSNQPRLFQKAKSSVSGSAAFCQESCWILNIISERKDGRRYRRSPTASSSLSAIRSALQKGALAGECGAVTGVGQPVDPALGHPVHVIDVDGGGQEQRIRGLHIRREARDVVLLRVVVLLPVVAGSAAAAGTNILIPGSARGRRLWLAAGQRSSGPGVRYYRFSGNW